MASIAALVSAAMAQVDKITYSVIASVISGQSVGVTIDNQTYQLSKSSDYPILYTSSATSGKL